MTRIASKGY